MKGVKEPIELLSTKLKFINLGTVNENNFFQWQNKTMHATLRNYKLHHITIILGNHLHNTHDHDRNIKLGSCWDGIFPKFSFHFHHPTKIFVWTALSERWRLVVVAGPNDRDASEVVLCAYSLALGARELFPPPPPIFRNIHKKILCRPTAKLGQIRKSLSDQFAGTFLILLPRLKKTHVKTSLNFFHHFFCFQ